MANNINLEELAKEQAIQDIKEELKKEHKHMLMFRKKLDPVMDALIKRHYTLANLKAGGY